MKLRGHRIELTAVESALCNCDGVIEAACRVQANGSGAELVAFVVTMSMMAVALFVAR